jgi:hypothetical protein
MRVPSDVLLTAEQRDRWDLTKRIRAVAVRYGDDAARQDLAHALADAARYRAETARAAVARPLNPPRPIRPEGTTR